MNQVIHRRTVPLTGCYQPEGDKSLSHRALLFASLAEGRSTIRRFLIGGVTKAMLRCLRQLGVNWTLDEEQHVLTVDGVGLKGFKTPTEPLHCGNSATTFRLLAGAIAGAGIDCVLDGSDGLRKRPMGRIADPLKQMGANVTTTNGCAPLTFAPAQLHGTHYDLPVASAQVKSCLILAALSADSDTTLTEPGPSRDHTERMLSAMGAKIRFAQMRNRRDEGENCESGCDGIGCAPRIPHSNRAACEAAASPLITHYALRITNFELSGLSPLDITLAGDISSAAFLMVASALVPGSEFVLEKVGINPTRTGIVDALRAMGAKITFENECEMAGEPVADIRVCAAPLHGVSVAGDLVVRMIDEFPAFMIAAAMAQGETLVRDAAELRTKESDRIAIMSAQLRAVGVEIEEYPDGFRIVGTGHIPGGATVEAHGDHRIAMSMALAGLVADAPITIQGFEMLNESFPDFPHVLNIV